MTVRECAVVEAFTGVCMLTGDKRKYFYEYIEEKLGRPVYTHELADDNTYQEIRKAAYDDFIKLCSTSDESLERTRCQNELSN